MTDSANAEGFQLAVWLLYGKGDRHLTAEMLYEEAIQAKVRISLATVYNTLNHLAQAGLLQRVSIDGSKTYFDTNVSAPSFRPRGQLRVGGSYES